MKYINEFNKQGHSFQLGLTRFGATTDEEFRSMHASSKIDHHRILQGGAHGRFMYENSMAVNDSVDRRVYGAVNSIKDQYKLPFCNCSSGWALSAIAAVEAINYISGITPNLLSLSEQQLVDCDRKQDKGCEGGTPTYAFGYIQSNGGVAEERQYPYYGCALSCLKYPPAATIDRFECGPPYNETAMTIAVSKQPISVRIGATSKAFQFYTAGVFSDPYCGGNLTHAVALIGYGTTYDGIKYWIARNSWNASWGEDGYMRIRRDVDDPRGILDQAPLRPKN